jgi:Kip1 ubiquitination-promoting complex protein 1
MEGPVLGELFNLDAAVVDAGGLGWHNIADAVDAELSSRRSEADRAMDTDEHAGGADADGADGRVGPEQVQICQELSNGNLRFRADDCDVESHSNFSSVRANACVFAGKWMYEVTLGSSGIQQLGWATHECRFTNEEGVGDSPQSYAYDGKRVRKWNVGQHGYGQAWEAGDVIGCLIDLDRKVVSFCRNGEDMGPAFENIGHRPGVAYFPALSLSMGERSAVNFGRWPMQYPQPGFSPVQVTPQHDVDAARYLLGCFRRLLPALISDDPLPGSPEGSPGAVSDGTAVLASFACFGPLGESWGRPHVIARELMPFLLESGADAVMATLEMMVACLEPVDLALVVSGVIDRCVQRCKMTSLGDDGAAKSLELAKRMLSNRNVLNIWLRSPAFPYQLEGLFAVKKPSGGDLAKLLPSVWWSDAQDPTCPACSQDEFEAAIDKLQQSVRMQHQLQQEVCDVMLSDTQPLGPSLLSDPDPAAQDDSSAKRRKVLEPEPESEPTEPEDMATGGAMPTDAGASQKGSCVEFVSSPFGAADRGYAGAECDHVSPSSMLRDWATQLAFRNAGAQQQPMPTPGASTPSLVSNVFFCFLDKLDGYRDPDITEATNCLMARFHGIARGSSSCTNRYPSLPRVGGLFSSICKEKPAADATTFSERVSEHGSAADFADTLEIVMLLYHVGVKQQLRFAGDALQTQIQAIAQLEELEKRIAALEDGAEALRHHTLTKQVIWEEITESSRLCVWFKLQLHRQGKLEAMFRACVNATSILGTLSAAAEASASDDSEAGTVASTAFSYLPEFYLDSMIDAFETLALRRLGEETTLPLTDPEHRPGLETIINFLASHFNSRSIINSDMRDSLIQCISKVLQITDYIPVFEQLEVRFQFGKALLRSFDAHCWLPVTSILLRQWRGSGFGDGLTPESQAAHQTGSEELQTVFVQCCDQEPQQTADFLNRVFDNLNWTMTEFGLSLAEVDGLDDDMAAAQAYRKCTIMFELSINLLRVLEFCCLRLSKSFLDADAEGSQVSLTRLVELMVHVLNKTTTGSDARTFDRCATPSVYYATLDHSCVPKS